ncbi:VENN motif pre-toxin domain-containing protein [Halomonas denitrificans]|uniref:VENN motif pre-toxin domain-containing protein n=1 Tax=Halomonas denitrificans TaxID=370769 RepID=UPI001C9926BB|nr:VENN motif pre-toxin domain-containing protein [Halomonas denitrificans]
MGGLAAEAAGGDFTTGALAAGANELLVDKLAGEYSDLDQADKGRLLVMNSQIIGVIAAEIASNDDSELQIGAQVAGSATQYNYLSHQQIDEYVDELDGCEARGDCGEVQAKYRDLSVAQQDQLISVCSQDQAACLDQYQSLVDDSEKFRQALDRLGDESLPWSVALDQGPLLGQYLEAESAVSQEGFAEFLRNEYDLDTDEAALISAAAMATAGGVGRAPKVPSRLEPFTNPPQGPVIPAGWVSRPGKVSGSIIYYPPGTDPSARGSTHIRVMPPGSTSVPGLENGYWISVSKGQPINPSTGKPGSRGEYHIPLPENTMPPER